MQKIWHVQSFPVEKCPVNRTVLSLYLSADQLSWLCWSHLPGELPNGCQQEATNLAHHLRFYPLDRVGRGMEIGAPRGNPYGRNANLGKAAGVCTCRPPPHTESPATTLPPQTGDSMA